MKRFRKGQWVVYKGRVGIHLGRRASGEAIGAVIFADGRQMQNVVTLGNTTEIHLVNVEGVTEEILFLSPETMEEVHTACIEEIPDSRRVTSSEGLLAARYLSRDR